MTQTKKLRVALVVPHIFMHRDILPRVIFSPGQLALDLAEGLSDFGVAATLFTPGPVDTTVPNVTADMSYFEGELAGRGDSYVDLLKKHPFTFVTLARQVQSEIIAAAYARANAGEFDMVHIYTNEEDTALPFAQFCTKPVVFTHHDPFNFLVKYKNNFPKYKHLNWLSMSLAQRRGMPADTNWVGNIYHGIDPAKWQASVEAKDRGYVAYLGRIIEPKGVHLAIAAVRQYNQTTGKPLQLKIAGKHYAEASNDTYWHRRILPQLGGDVEYIGFIKSEAERNELLAGAKALIVPSTFDEPFGLVMIEALASGAPIIGLDSGAIPEVVTENTGIVVSKAGSEDEVVRRLTQAIAQVGTIDRQACRTGFEARFTLEHMCESHATIYGLTHKDVTIPGHRHADVIEA